MHADSHIELEIRHSKSLLRGAMKERVRALPPDERARRTALASSNLVNFLMNRLPAGAPIALYAATPTELATEEVARHLAPRHPLAFPRVDGSNLQFQAAELASLEAHASLVREPAPEAPVVSPRAIVIPGRAFDRLGVRLGRGAGYFDRTLDLLSPEVLLVGYVFAFQLVDRLPRAPHDRRVHWVVTDEGTPHACEQQARG